MEILCDSVVMKLSDICEIRCNQVKINSSKYGEYPIYISMEEKKVFIMIIIMKNV